ncbi:unnamed protein product, partial [Didymodactylos carnosus]
TIVLLVDLIKFLIVSTPVLIIEIIYRLTRHNTLKYEQILSLSWLIANKIFYLNYSLSFYLYVLTSSYFRQQFLNAIYLPYGIYSKNHRLKISKQTEQTCLLTNNTIALKESDN